MTIDIHNSQFMRLFASDPPPPAKGSDKKL